MKFEMPMPETKTSPAENNLAKDPAVKAAEGLLNFTAEEQKRLNELDEKDYQGLSQIEKTEQAELRKKRMAYEGKEPIGPIQETVETPEASNLTPEEQRELNDLEFRANDPRAIAREQLGEQLNEKEQKRYNELLAKQRGETVEGKDKLAA